MKKLPRVTGSPGQVRKENLVRSLKKIENKHTGAQALKAVDTIGNNSK